MRVAFSGLAPRAEPLRACVRPPSARAGLADPAPTDADLADPAPTDAGLADPAPTSRPGSGRPVGSLVGFGPETVRRPFSAPQAPRRHPRAHRAEQRICFA